MLRASAFTGRRGATQLRDAAPVAGDVWNKGGAVAVRCDNCFHRGPLALAVLLKVVFGTDIHTSLRFIAENHRSIWARHHFSYHNSKNTLEAHQWAE